MLEYHPHAERQLEERRISKAEAEKVLNKPREILDTDIPTRKIAQKIIIKAGKKFLYRVIYMIKNGNKLIITIYRTTKIKKYLRGDKK